MLNINEQKPLNHPYKRSITMSNEFHLVHDSGQKPVQFIFWGCLLFLSVHNQQTRSTREEAVEKTGEVVGKGAKKGWGIAKGIGKGLMKGVKGEEKKKQK